MTFRKVLLPISGDDDVTPLAAMAFAVASRFNGQVEGLFIHVQHIAVPYLAETPETSTVQDLVERAQRQHQEMSHKAEADLQAFAKRHSGVPATFLAREGSTDAVIAAHGRLADMIVVGDARRYDSAFWDATREAALFQTGRPVMVAPGEALSPNLGENILIAWRNQREASRAVAAAKPLLAMARCVHAVTVGGGPGDLESLRGMEAYLALHGAEVRCEAMADGRDIGARLLDKARELDGVILVMGAYSHWRWREWVFGGVTQYILRETDVPAFMAH